MKSGHSPVCEAASVKIAYADETGTDGVSQVVVMVGVLADTARMGRTKSEFEAIFADLGELSSKALRELKSTDLYRGKKNWYGVDGEQRHAMISRLCTWVGQRKHQLTLAAVDLNRWRPSPNSDVDDPWLAVALHTALQIQRANQRIPKGKGVAFLVFDEQKQKADALAELLFEPPAWTDEYYGRGRKQEQLDQVLDTAFYAKSHHAGLVQVADLFAFIFRRHVELSDFEASEEFEGEAARITDWVNCLGERLIPIPHRWPKKPKSDAAKWYVDIAPRSLLNLD